MCLRVYVCPCVWLQTHMPQHLCVAARGQTWVSVLAFHILFVVWCCARQAGWPRGSRTSVCLPVSLQEGWITKHPSLCGSGYLNWGPPTQLKTLYLLSHFSTWNIFIYIIWSKRQKSLLWFGCFPKIHVLETQSLKSSMQRCWKMRPNDPVGAESSWTGHCRCQGSR